MIPDHVYHACQVAIDIGELDLLRVRFHGEFGCDVRADGDPVVRFTIGPKGRTPAFGHPQYRCRDHDGITARKLQLAIGRIHLFDRELHRNLIVRQVWCILKEKWVLQGRQCRVENGPGQFIPDLDIHHGVGCDAIWHAPVWKPPVHSIGTTVAQVLKGFLIVFGCRDGELHEDFMVTEVPGGRLYDLCRQVRGIEQLDISPFTPQSMPFRRGGQVKFVVDKVSQQTGVIRCRLDVNVHDGHVRSVLSADGVCDPQIGKVNRPQVETGGNGLDGPGSIVNVGLRTVCSVHGVQHLLQREWVRREQDRNLPAAGAALCL